MRKDARQKEVKLRKNFFPTLLITIVLWTLLAGLIYFVDPFALGAIPAFFILVFLALLFTFSFLFVSTRRGVIFAVAITIFLILRYFGVGNVLNLLLIIGVLIALEIYFLRK
ncbi:hypothetical protein A2V56_05440 [Candidatus Woesebacteria bacterium RBG_19FT_COMBO_42_9]|uniref:Uncharacterized protein n=1 Tax=Candidatus Woesebacteria bacterium RBG_16_42_24 TaxID=1802485 RepID=A0A1F7XLE3_9BACT|nr:MAG: hypothetical protein A2V97_03705 [Candidatus Woesebacteria bacterium RBG_16_42_24]OGM17320.1 MAG: hypothetical protein A2V56_05440 [Candidatus Woesebacteria bacterium RBG_19FT_COMBO_42_9]OGM67249.1 MAG: hypothetical protein A2985_03820 [Candidatus Woesebacteria bacterium RIFCSPLOWO2_01_FULL_43_11]